MRLLALFVACLLTQSSLASDQTHKYKDQEQVKLWLNKVGPYNNPQQTYNYHTLPLCAAKPTEQAQKKFGGLGEVLEGNELIDSQLDIQFKVDQSRGQICRQTLGEYEAAKLARAVDSEYWFEMFLDDLPIWGFIGEKGSGGASHLVFTHRRIDITYNENRVITVNLRSEEPEEVRPGASLAFTYSVSWLPTTIPFKRRFDRYLDYNFFEHQIHWFSIFNSTMMVVFLTGLVSMILLRTLRSDYARYAKEDDDLESLERDVSEETGWKLVHGDVFRSPPRLELLASFVGIGAQLALLTLFVILSTIAGVLYESRGSIATVSIVLYALTSFISGYVSGGLHSRYGGRKWIRCYAITATVLPGSFSAVGLVLNTIATLYHSLAAVPFGTVSTLFAIWLLVSAPLVLVGFLVGRNWNGQADHPCRVKAIPRPIPRRRWFLRPFAVSALGGLLPFGSIFIEMYFVFTSFWNYKVYYVYGFFLLVFLIMLAVVLCVTVVGTYFLLNAENYKWQWTSFASAASTGAYVFLYSIYYFCFKTNMTGLFQTAFYFGYTLLFCLCLALLCGSVGHGGASSFVRRIYRRVKVD